MIYLNIAGRCGNQMFQYSFARKLSILNNNEEITIDFYLMDEYAKIHNDPTFRDELCGFEASKHYIKIIDGSNKIYKFGSKKQIFVFKVYTKIKRILQKFIKDKRIANKLLYGVMSHYGIYWYKAPKKLIKCNQKNKFVFGYFEDTTYFNDIKKVLIEDFSPIYSVNKENQEIYRIVKNSESVCVSFRQWETTGGTNVAIRQVCDKGYYIKAFDYYNKNLPDALFVIFSNNMEWVRENFDLPENCIFESGNDPVYEKVRLMSSCTHFILSNSTFAWWVQYLGQSEDKIVVSPDRWYNGEKKRNPLILENFTVVS